jgi:hypothetical protein
MMMIEKGSEERTVMMNEIASILRAYGNFPPERLNIPPNYDGITDEIHLSSIKRDYEW